MSEKKIDIYKIRKAGKQLCDTDGSEHYKSKEGEIEPIEYMISKGIVMDFAVGNIIKYISRFKKTRNLKDISKVADYAHILAGCEKLNIRKD